MIYRTSQQKSKYGRSIDIDHSLRRDGVVMAVCWCDLGENWTKLLTPSLELR